MDRDAAIAALKKDPIFAYRGPEDISLLPSPNQSLIEVAGLSFVKRGYFQFYEGKLWVMILELNPGQSRPLLDIYEPSRRNTASPILIDPKEARWEDKATRMALERPLTLRYMDMTVYDKLREGATAKDSPRSWTGRASWRLLKRGGLTANSHNSRQNYHVYIFPNLFLRCLRVCLRLAVNE